MKGAEIKKAHRIKKIFCNHSYFMAYRLQDIAKLRNKKISGVTIYKVCAKCGKIKRIEYVQKEQFYFYSWDSVHCFIEQDEKIIGYLNSDIANFMKNIGGKNG